MPNRLLLFSRVEKLGRVEKHMPNRLLLFSRVEKLGRVEKLAVNREIKIFK